ncbi:MAG TPA: J domain-containing protein [Verrucomicrobiae bacterium]
MPVEFKDYYAILGVPRSATDTEIKKAFRKLAREYHPDVAKDKKIAEEKFKEINEAYEVLSDPAKRKKYDALGANWNRGGGFEPPPGWQQDRDTRWSGPDGSQHYEFHFGGTGFSDFFEQFFGGGRGGGFEDVLRQAAARGTGGHAEFDGHTEPAQRGQDIEGDLLVTLEEALRGSVRSISLRRINPRSGQAETHTFKVRIPSGVQDGQTIRVPGQGGNGSREGLAGDLYLHVRLAAHPHFRPRGADLYHDLDLAPWEAVLGCTVEAPTLDGKVTVRIPPGTNNGQQLRVRGRGLPRGSGGERGDLYVVVNVEMPKHISDEERAAWEQLARISKFNPRQ